MGTAIHGFTPSGSSLQIPGYINSSPSLTVTLVTIVAQADYDFCFSSWHCIFSFPSGGWKINHRSCLRATGGSTPRLRPRPGSFSRHRPGTGVQHEGFAPRLRGDGDLLQDIEVVPQAIPGGHQHPGFFLNSPLGLNALRKGSSTFRVSQRITRSLFFPQSCWREIRRSFLTWVGYDSLPTSASMGTISGFSGNRHSDWISRRPPYPAKTNSTLRLPTCGRIAPPAMPTCPRTRDSVERT